jgi:hypothetical protein
METAESKVTGNEKIEAGLMRKLGHNRATDYKRTVKKKDTQKEET